MHSPGPIVPSLMAAADVSRERFSGTGEGDCLEWRSVRGGIPAVANPNGRAPEYTVQEAVDEFCFCFRYNLQKAGEGLLRTHLTSPWINTKIHKRT